MHTRAPVVAISVAALTLGAHVAAGQQPTALPAATRPPAAPAPTPAGALGAVRGVAYDSLTPGPLAGATVQIARAPDLLGGRAVVADSAGVFRMDSLAPGRYLVGVEHPLLDLLHVEVRPRLVELGPGGDTVRVDLALPALARMRPVLCGSPQAPSDSTGLLAGRVRDASDDASVANATVVLAWSELAVGAGGVHTEHRRVPVVTGPGGTYVACGVPAGVELALSVAAPGRAGGPVALELPPRGFVVRDLTLGDTVSVVTAAAALPGRTAARPTAGAAARDTATAAVARGTARLTGTVRDSAGRPVRGARAFVWGTAAAATVDADGTFTLAGLPAGTRTLEVRAIGFAVRRVAVDLAPGRAGTVDVRMNGTVASLDPVTVYGKASPASLQLREFLERRRHSAFGRFLTAEDLERWHPVQVTDALQGMPGLQIAPNGRLGNTILGRGKNGSGSCRATVVLDGTALPPGDEIDQYLSPQQVGGIEVYADPAFAPPEYGDARMTGCSIVLIWTRR
ncbi:hypothetical protein tb265_20370 [Gemmatimonadetes bacterium T265]|nr:hypothetical protein tb265_20370 [Gemmatimonadetes bacterium T265]